MNDPRDPDIKERTFEFALRIVSLCRALEESGEVSRTLAGEILRCGAAIGAHVGEAHGNHSKAEFIDKMAVATREARETNYWLRLLAASRLGPAGEVAELTDESGQLTAILTTIVKRSRENRA